MINLFFLEKIIHLMFCFSGGGGVGKSFLIRLISQYVNKDLRKVGDDPNRPKVIILAPTGIAASLIGNHTIK